MTGRRPSERAGMTLVELTVAMTIFSIIVAGGLGFLASQTNLFARSVERTSALTRIRYAVHELKEDLPTLGSNVASGQPELVYAGADVIAFNADYASNVPNDVFAVFVDTDAPAAEVTAPTSPLTIPRTAVVYGDTTYETGAGTNSPAELLVFYFEPDTSTADADDFALYRRVNHLPAERLATGLYRQEGQPFFEYSSVSSGGGMMTMVPAAELPLVHTAKVHLGPADTGAAAKIDSVRAVTVRIEARHIGRAASSAPLRVSRAIPMPNAGLRQTRSCGSRPILLSVLSAVPTVLPSGDPAIDLSWTPAMDEASGEGDVVRYLIWRQEAPAGTWDDPFLSIPAGSATYAYTDAEVLPGTTYVYALAAQDCTPSLSDITQAGPIDVP
jgi:prepilin-type N-terminal cleavage/methylation domain-containing protein